MSDLLDSLPRFADPLPLCLSFRSPAAFGSAFVLPVLRFPVPLCLGTSVPPRRFQLPDLSLRLPLLSVHFPLRLRTLRSPPKLSSHASKLLSA